MIAKQAKLRFCNDQPRKYAFFIFKTRLKMTIIEMSERINMHRLRIFFKCRWWSDAVLVRMWFFFFSFYSRNTKHQQCTQHTIITHCNKVTTNAKLAKRPKRTQLSNCQFYRKLLRTLCMKTSHSRRS